MIIKIEEKQRRMEKEANWFAAAFLMPEAKYRKSYEDNQGEHIFIARHFGVTKWHSHLRAVSLELESLDESFAMV